MVKALLLVADGSEEIEFVAVYDVFVRAGFEVKTAGVKLEDEKFATLSRGLRVLPTHPTLLTVPAQHAHVEYDVLVLPGGAPGAKTFCESEEVREMVGRFREGGKVVGAICAATTALVAAETSHSRGKVRVTSHPSVKNEVISAGWEYSEERVVLDRKIVTSRGPGTAILFALTLVEVLAGKEKRDEVAGPMVLADVL